MRFRRIVEHLFEKWVVRAIVGGLLFARGGSFLLFGQVYKASVDYCWVYRVSDVRLLRALSLPIIKWIIKAGDRTEQNLIRNSFLKGKEALRARQQYSLSGKGSLDLMRDVIVLKEKAEDEKGVILIKYTPTFDAFLSFFDVERMLKDYYIVLEISWSGACDPSILMFISARNQVVIQVPEKEDFDFIAELSSNLLPISLGSGDWVDPDTFVFDSSVEKKYDVIMVANWGSYKRHDELFRALSKLKPRLIKVLLVGFAWGGRTKDDILKDMSKFDLTHVSVEIKEKIPPAEVHKCLNASKVYLLLSKKEGGNKAMVEGFFSNVPAILYENNKGGNREKINSGTGMLSSYEDLPEKIVYVLENGKKFSPRRWAIQNTGSRNATVMLNEYIKGLAKRNKEKWTADIVEKINSPNLSYRHPEHKNKMRNANWEFYLRP
jgi:glycosyltransferase involved in cell wall biosynthesis